MFPIALALLMALFGQTADHGKLERQVSGQVLTSGSNPAVQITFDQSFKYAGGQSFILYGVAEAEQHFFVQTSAGGKVERFYWLQFEHYLPDNQHQYDYPPTRTLEAGGLTFVHDTRIFSDYAGGSSNPQSDSGKTRELFKNAGLNLPAHMARIRMFHLTDSSRRSELMIIYGEALEDKAAAGSADGVSADEQAPEIALRLRQHALEAMKIQKR